ncbi:hypothetical protein J2S30_000856 [Herbaspirillum rubrisubalbicans]|uniref:hypothetical protein n=1 Tax=Herbaspirillum rubrisubalbicans TaxID=80842 RepID=UPI001885A516|nr:hypothetical protein [Herbaspirillum rubrisubalbicans]MCP1572477.1 hypothetical protein [Herbaspirillum rubrisubalbicans]
MKNTSKARHPILGKRTKHREWENHERCKPIGADRVISLDGKAHHQGNGILRIKTRMFSWKFIVQLTFFHPLYLLVDQISL